MRQPKNSIDYTCDAMDCVEERSGAIIDNITFVCGEKRYSHGGSGDSEHSFKLDNDESIVTVEGVYSRFGNRERISALSFTTNKDRKFSVGNAGSSYKFRFEAPKGYAYLRTLWQC